MHFLTQVSLWAESNRDGMLQFYILIVLILISYSSTGDGSNIVTASCQSRISQKRKRSHCDILMHVLPMWSGDLSIVPGGSWVHTERGLLVMPPHGLLGSNDNTVRYLTGRWCPLMPFWTLTSIQNVSFFWPKNLATLKPRGKNFGDMFLDVFRPAESKSEVSFSPKNPDHEISKLSYLFVRNCSLW